MKKINKILSLILCGAATAGLCACGGSDKPNVPPETSDKEQVLYFDFEDFDTSFALIRMTDYCGAIHVNRDTRYAKGKQSALVHPLGRYTSGDNATFVFPSSSTDCGFDYSDFRKTTSISFDFYNAEEEVVKVAVGLTPTIRSTGEITYTKLEWQNLQPNAWTTVKYEVDTRALGFVYDVSSIAGFYMTFENAGSRDEEDAHDIYLDDIYINRLTSAPPENESFVLDGMEYLDFEDKLQEGMIESGGRAGHDAYIVKASDETVNGQRLQATSGENVLKMQFDPVAQNTGGFSYIRFSDVVTQNSMFKGMTISDAKNMVLSFDIFNASNEVKYIEFDFLYYDDCIFGGFYLQPNQWTTVRYGLEDVLNKYKDFASHGKLRFVMSEFEGNESKVFYLDNVRFEWASDLSQKG